MVLINGQMSKPDGSPATTPFKLWLVNYGTQPSTKTLYVSPEAQVVQPSETGEFSFEVWANVEGDVPCYYRVQFDFGLTLKISVPPTSDPDGLEFTDLILDDTVELVPGLISRVSKLESTGGVTIPAQNFSLGGWLTSAPVNYDGTTPVVLSADSINANGLVNTIPRANLSGSYPISLDNALTFGNGLVAGSYSGTTPTTLAVDFTKFVLPNDTRLTDPREWVAATVSQVEAETGTGTGRRAWTPLRVFEAVAAWVSQYLPSATLEEAELGTGTENRSWSPSKLTALVSAYLTSGSADVVSSVAGKTGNVTLVPGDVGLGNVQNLDFTNASNLLTGTVSSARVVNISGNAPTATRLATPRAINGVAFDGTAPISVPTPSSLTFGTGLSSTVGSSFNGSSATTLSIDTGVVVQQSDSRLTDAREWSASTVTQVEAETGIATTRRAWTAQRVFQAISSWWNTSASKTKLDTIATGAQVNTVTSVASKTGAVSLVPGDVGLGNVPNVNATVASNISTGTLADTRLSSNVNLLNATQTVSGSKTYSSPIIVTSTTNATSTTSAASLQTSGGIACAGDIYANKVSYTQSDIISFTPTLVGTGWGYSVQFGRYVREGRKIEFVIDIRPNVIGTVPSVRVLGLPGAISVTFLNVRLTNTSGLPESHSTWAWINTNGDIYLGYNTGSTSSSSTLQTTNLTTSSLIYLAGSYITAS